MVSAVVVLAVILVIWIVGSYNSLVNLANHADAAWSDIDVALKNRWDLVPNLVTTVKSYAKHEAALFKDVTQARANAYKAKTVYQKDMADTALGSMIGNLFAIAENYPKLMASDNFVSLQKQLSDIEDTIASARKYYNGTVRNLNIKIRTFPTSLVAKSMGFEPRDFFEVDHGERANISIGV